MAHLWYQEHIRGSGNEDHTAFVAHEVAGVEESGERRSDGHHDDIAACSLSCGPKDEAVRETYSSGQRTTRG